jgi:hypothetical protein
VRYVLALVLTTAAPSHASDTQFVHALSVPRVLPCKSASFLAAGRSSPALDVAVMFGSEPVLLPSFATDLTPTTDQSDSGRLGAEPIRVELRPGTVRLRPSVSVKKQDFWFWLRAQCSEDPEGASVNWSCGATGCTMMAVYDPPDPSALDTGEEWPSLSKRCIHLTDGLAPPETCAADLVGIGRSPAADLAASLERLCTNGPCSGVLARSIPLVKTLGAPRDWRLVDRHPQPTRLWDNDGRAWMVRLETLRGTVGLVCIRMVDYEGGDPPECGLQLSMGKDRLTLSRDPIDRVRHLSIPRGSAEISDRLVLSGRAIAAERNR